MCRQAARCGPSSSWISDGVETPRAGGLLGAGEALKTRIGRAAAAFILLALGHAAAADEPAIRTGAKIYENNCSNCHGDDLQNNSSIAFDLRRLKTDEHSRFVNSVLHGKNAMPSWEGALTMDQIENLWAYICAHASQ
jgi:mono/diheme cytochrome c family protein